MASKYEMPKKIPAYIRRLELMYRSDSSSIYHQIVCNASVYVREEVSYDNWDGGTAGHALVFFLEEDVLQKISNFETQKEICKNWKMISKNAHGLFRENL